jgi:hypothetical protein
MKNRMNKEFQHSMESRLIEVMKVTKKFWTRTRREYQKSQESKFETHGNHIDHNKIWPSQRFPFKRKTDGVSAGNRRGATSVRWTNTTWTVSLEKSADVWRNSRTHVADICRRGPRP